jgi:hypothetical protein
MGMMDNMDMSSKRERFEELRRREEEGTIDDDGRMELQSLRSELFGKDTI